MDLANTKVLITGGATGIGLATAQAMAAGGAKVAVCGRREEPLVRAREEFGFAAFQGDVSVEGDAVRIVSDSAEALGGLNVLINNAAFGSFATLVDTAIRETREEVGVDLTAHGTLVGALDPLQARARGKRLATTIVVENKFPGRQNRYRVDLFK